MWRIFQLNKHLSKQGHVWSKFGSGNRDSLSKAAKDLKSQGRLFESVAPSLTNSLAPSPIPSRISSPAPSVTSTSSETEADGGAIGRETRRRLVEWWSKEYCASRMRLCIIGQGMFALGPIVLFSITYALNRVLRRTFRNGLYVIFTHPQSWPRCSSHASRASFRAQ